MQNARHWIGTISKASGWVTPTDPLEAPLVWVKGQEEIGEGGFNHYQLVASFSRQVRLAQVKRLVGDGHWEPTRSDAAEKYVWKEDTRVPESQFEFGRKPMRRNNAKDWDAILVSAKSGNLDEIPSDVMLRCYSNIIRIGSVKKINYSILQNQLLSNERFMCFGAELVLERVVGRGKKLGYLLTLSHRLPNGGMVTADINQWLSTNFEEKLELDTCYGGLTGTRLLWKQKEVRLYSKLHRSGLQAIYHPKSGFQV